MDLLLDECHTICLRLQEGEYSDDYMNNVWNLMMKLLEQKHKHTALFTFKKLMYTFDDFDEVEDNDYIETDNRCFY